MATAPEETKAPAQVGTGIPRKPLSDSPGAFRIGALMDPMRRRYGKFLFYGSPGTGKTTLAGTAVDVEPMRDVLAIQFEGGEEVLLDNPRIKNSDLIDVVRINSMAQLVKLYNFLTNHCRARDRDDEDMLILMQNAVFHGDVDATGQPNNKVLHAEDRLRKYHTVIIDSLTEVEAANLATTLNLDAQGIEVGGDAQTAGWDEYRKNNHTMQRNIRAFRDLDMNVIFICAQSYNQDEMKRFHYTPAMTGKLTTQVQGFVDLVGWLIVGANDKGLPERRLAVQPHTGPKADAKNRFAKWPDPYFIDPKMSSIMVGCGLLTPTETKKSS
jgi:hypothetical protein